MRRYTSWVLLVGFWTVGLSLGRAQGSGEVVQTEPVPGMGAGQLEQQFANEPTMQEVYRMAEKEIGLHPEKIEKWYKKVKSRFWFPELRALVRYEDDLAESPAFSFREDPDRIIERESLDFGKENDKLYEIRAIWKLSEAIWDRQGHRDIVSATQRVLRMRTDLLREVSQIYYERRRHQVELLMSPPSNPLARMEKELRVQELGAGLDVLTGGGFSGGATR